MMRNNRIEEIDPPSNASSTPMSTTNFSNTVFSAVVAVKSRKK